MPLVNHVSLINDPRNVYHKAYGVKYLQNVVEGLGVLHYNVPMNILRDAVKKSIDENIPVWFGCDVGQFLHSKSKILDKKLFDIEGYLGITFNLNKRERIEYSDSLMTHAMVITGYNVDQYGQIDRWEIENSWGDGGKSKGYYTMTDEWMKEFVYQITVDSKFIPEHIKKISDEDVHLFEPWDPMGSLA